MDGHFLSTIACRSWLGGCKERILLVMDAAFSVWSKRAFFCMPAMCSNAFRCVFGGGLLADLPKLAAIDADADGDAGALTKSGATCVD